MSRWSVRKFGYEKYAIEDERGAEIGFAHRRGDAHVIAAAPAMRELLTILADWMEKHGHWHKAGQARDLVAVADGESISDDVGAALDRVNARRAASGMSAGTAETNEDLAQSEGRQPAPKGTPKHGSAGQTRRG